LHPKQIGLCSHRFLSTDQAIPRKLIMKTANYDVSLIASKVSAIEIIRFFGFQLMEMDAVHFYMTDGVTINFNQILL
jgi:hypothetical protein